MTILRVIFLLAGQQWNRNARLRDACEVVKLRGQIGINYDELARSYGIGRFATRGSRHGPSPWALPLPGEQSAIGENAGDLCNNFHNPKPGIM